MILYYILWDNSRKLFEALFEALRTLLLHSIPKQPISLQWKILCTDSNLLLLLLLLRLLLQISKMASKKRSPKRLNSEPTASILPTAASECDNGENGYRKSENQRRNPEFG